jgi:hypothetical protein
MLDSPLRIFHELLLALLLFHLSASLGRFIDIRVIPNPSHGHPTDMNEIDHAPLFAFACIGLVLVFIHLYVDKVRPTVDLEIGALTAALYALQHTIMDKGKACRCEEVLHMALFGVPPNLNDLWVTCPTFPIRQDIVQAAFRTSFHAQVLCPIRLMIVTVTRTVCLMGSQLFASCYFAATIGISDHALLYMR